MQSASPGFGGGGGATPTPASTGTGGAQVINFGSKPINGGRFDFDDGGTYCGGWEDGKAHGHGVCTGPKGQGEYSGSWHFGFEVSGVYTWPSGSTFEGQWQNGKRHGLGVEYRGRWTYRGEWTQGFKGRYGVRQATASNAKYEGTWANGLQDGYGSETYADGGTFQGQWLRGFRHGYGVRTSAPFGMASHFRPKAQQGSMTSLKSESAAEPTSERDRRMDDVRGGFVLKAKSDEPPARRRSLSERSSNFKDSILKGLKLRKQRSTGDLDKRGTNSSIRSAASSASWMSNESAVTSGSHHTDSNASFVVEDGQMDASVTETYMGEWKNDKRAGFGISERSDGLKYEGEWFNNKKYGFGVTTFKDGAKEEGKYKNNVLITSQKKKHLFLIRSAKFRERIDAAVNAAQRASKIALQKADIAISRTATARGKAEQADISASHAREDSDMARVIAKQFDPDFHQPGIDSIKPIPRMAPPPLPSLQPDLKDQRLLSASQQYLAGRQPSAQNFIGFSTASANTPQFEEINVAVPPPPVPSFPPRGPPQVPDRLDRTASQFSQPQQPTMDSMYGPASTRVNELPGMMNYPSSALRPEQSEVKMNNMNYNNRSSWGGGGGGGSGGGGDIGPPLPADRGRDTVRRPPQPVRSSSQQQIPSSQYSFQQAMSDHFDHYKRPPSRDPSLDTYGARNRSRTRGATPEIHHAVGGSRAQSRARTPGFMAEGGRTGSNAAIDALLGMEGGGGGTPPVRGQTPSRFSARPETPGAGSGTGSAAGDLEGLRTRGGLGQEIPPSIYTPKRTESLFLKTALGGPGPSVPAAAGGGAAMPKGGGGVSFGGAGPSTGTGRKKSLPDSVSLPRATFGIPREELAALGSQRRQELHRMADEQERLRANPLLYLLNPNLMNWLSRQKFMILVMLINLTLAIVFLHLLT